MRLIDADAIHSTLADWQLMLSETYGTNDEFVRCLEDVLCTVDNTPTIAAPRWHRCEVDMPTKAGWYLVMDVDGDFNVDEWRNTFGWQFITPSDADRITHWMPIEPPKEAP